MGSDQGRFVLAAIAAVTMAIPGSAEGQRDSATGYDQAALRVERTFWSDNLVRGSQSEKVAGLGGFAPKIPIFAQSGDSVRRYYESFRSRGKTGSWLTLGGAALIVTSLFIIQDDGAAGFGVALAGLGVTLGGRRVLKQSRDDLDRAVWWYNREFH